MSELNVYRLCRDAVPTLPKTAYAMSLYPYLDQRITKAKKAMTRTMMITRQLQ